MAKATARIPGTRAELLALLKEACGYDGGEDLATVKKFMQDENTVLHDENDQPIDIDGIWSKTAAKPTVIKFDTSAGETEDEREARLSGSTTRLPSRKATTGNKVTAINAAIERHDTKPDGLYFGDADSIAKKSYDNRRSDFESMTYAQKRTVSADRTPFFKTADEAEIAGAWLRFKFCDVNNHRYEKADSDLRILEKAGSSFNPYYGSNLIPSEFVPAVLYATEMFGVCRKVANVVQMKRDNMKHPRQTGRFTMSHVGQSGTQTAADVPTDLVELTAKEIIGLGRLPRSLVDDAAVDVASLYISAMGEGQAYREDQDFTLGDGTSTYGGHVGLANALPSGAYISGTSGTNSAWSSFTETDPLRLVKVVENIGNVRDCSFMCSRQFYFAGLLPTTSASGRGTMNEMLTVNGIGGPADAQWRGWPVYFNELMPTTEASSAKVLYFGNFRVGSMLGDRKQFEVTTSEHRYFDNNQIAIRAVSRIAVHICGDGRGGTYGPIVCLKSAA